jgi:hypothetical protein
LNPIVKIFFRPRSFNPQEAEIGLDSAQFWFSSPARKIIQPNKISAFGYTRSGFWPIVSRPFYTGPVWKKSIANEPVEIFPRRERVLTMDSVTGRDQPDPCLEQIQVWI